FLWFVIVPEYISRTARRTKEKGRLRSRAAPRDPRFPRALMIIVVGDARLPALGVFETFHALVHRKVKIMFAVKAHSRAVLFVHLPIPASRERVPGEVAFLIIKGLACFLGRCGLGRVPRHFPVPGVPEVGEISRPKLQSHRSRFVSLDPRVGRAG